MLFLFCLSMDLSPLSKSIRWLLPPISRVRNSYQISLSMIRWSTSISVTAIKAHMIWFSNWMIPRTASATRALLRLTPCHQAYRRPIHDETSGIPDSLELTGGEYKTWERIHRGMADPRLLAIPASWGRVADLNPNWRRFSNDLLHLTILRRVVTAIVLCV